LEFSNVHAGVTSPKAPLSSIPRAVAVRRVSAGGAGWMSEEACRRSCPNGANGESPGWNPGNRVREMFAVP